jgi:hypothetical protein
MKSLRYIITSAVVTSLASVIGPTVLARTEIRNAVQPQLSAALDGRVWLVYSRPDETLASSGHGDHGNDSKHHAGHGATKKKGGHGPAPRSGGIFVAVSSDDGATFSEGVKIAALPKSMVGNRRGPRIAAHGDRVTVTAIGNELVAFTSADAGKTWSRAVRINDVDDSAHEGLHDLAVSPDGELFVTWLDLRNGKTELWGASSKDAGVTWETDQLVYKSPDKSICECCHPSALFDHEGNLALMWRNSIEGARDMWLTIRPRGGANFTPARKLGEGTWRINGCPHDGGTLVALGGGKFGAVWQREGKVFVIGTERQETMLGAGRQPVAASADGQTVVVWNDGSRLVAKREPRQTQASNVATEARFPSVVSLAAGKGVVLAYERIAEGAASIAVDRL